MQRNEQSNPPTSTAETQRHRSKDKLHPSTESIIFSLPHLRRIHTFLKRLVHSDINWACSYRSLFTTWLSITCLHAIVHVFHLFCLLNVTVYIFPLLVGSWLRHTIWVIVRIASQTHRVLHASLTISLFSNMASRSEEHTSELQS